MSRESGMWTRGCREKVAASVVGVAEAEAAAAEEEEEEVAAAAMRSPQLLGFISFFRAQR